MTNGFVTNVMNSLKVVKIAIAMNPATQWRDELCNKYILNSREGGWLIEFIERIQNDAMGTPIILYEQPKVTVSPECKITLDASKDAL